MSEMIFDINIDAEAIARIEATMRAGANRTSDAIRRAINRSGDMARTQVVKTLVKQTGLKYGTIHRAVVPTRANYGSLIYKLRAVGGNVSLKYFGARETRAGVTAAPWGVRHLYAGAFISGGQFPNRVPIKGLYGHVFQRAGGSRLPIEKLKSGVFIPKEMDEGDSAAAFMGTVKAVLPRRVEHEVGVIFKGIVR
jgi:hypothetical protein